MIWYPLRGPSRSRARIAARTSPRPAFWVRAEPGGPGHQPSHGPPKPPRHSLGPLGRPKPGPHGPPRQLWPRPPDIVRTAPWTCSSRRPRQLRTSKRGGSKSPAVDPAAGILRPQTSRSRYDHDISSPYNAGRAAARHSALGGATVLPPPGAPACWGDRRTDDHACQPGEDGQSVPHRPERCDRCAQERPGRPWPQRSGRPWPPAHPGRPGRWAGHDSPRLPDRPHLDRAVPRGGNSRRHLDRVVQVLAVDDEEAGDLLPGLAERAAADHDLAAVPAPHRGRRFRRAQLLAAHQRAVGPYLVLERGEPRDPP